MRAGGGYSWRTSASRRPRNPAAYAQMTVDEIEAIDVASVAPDSRAFLWTTQRWLDAAFEVLDAWGYEYRCTLVWVKQPTGWAPGGEFMSGNVEFCLYGARGEVPSRLDAKGRPLRINRQWFDWPRPYRVTKGRGEHSVKPDEFYDLVTATFPGPYLELFQRRGRLGWDAAGNEALSTVEVAGVANA